MPTVAIVDGEPIEFYPSEHPPPHFHAIFAEHRAQIDIRRLVVLRGALPPAKIRAVLAWATQRQPELFAAWAALEARRKPSKIT